MTLDREALHANFMLIVAEHPDTVYKDSLNDLCIKTTWGKVRTRISTCVFLQGVIVYDGPRGRELREAMLAAWIASKRRPKQRTEILSRSAIAPRWWKRWLLWMRRVLS